MHVVGIDLSLTATGIAHTYPGDDTTIVETLATNGTRDDNLATRHQRLTNIDSTILALTRGATLAVIEGPAFSRSNPGMHDRSGLWWLVVDSLMRNDIPLAVASPSCRAKYATGKGNAPKDTVLLAVARRYPTVDVSNNNEADALILAAMGTRHLGHPIDDMPKTHLTAMDAVEWPDHEGLAIDLPDGTHISSTPRLTAMTGEYAHAEVDAPMKPVGEAPTP